MSKWIFYIVTLIIFTGCFNDNNGLLLNHKMEQVIMIDTTYEYEHYNVGKCCFITNHVMVIDVDTLEIDVFY